MKQIIIDPGKRSTALLVLLSITWAVYLLVPILTAPEEVPPVSITRVETINSPIQTGQPLWVRVTREKVRDDCPVTSIRYATNQDGAAFDIEDSIALQGGPIGSYFELAYPTHDLPAGQYNLHVKLIYDCPERDYYVDQPTVMFRVQDDG